MLNLQWGVLIFLMMIPLHAQSTDWDKINSNTIFNMITMHNGDQDLSHSNVIQIGDFNNAELSLNDRTHIAVKQLGDYNTLYFINSFTDRETRTSITTQGNNNIIDVTGSNSISEGMQINMKGDNKTVFMRNY